MANRVWLRRWATGWLVLGVVVASACGGDAQPDEQAAVDREMDLAIQEGAAEPELRDVPQEDQAAEQAAAAREPAARQPAEQQPAPAERQPEVDTPAPGDPSAADAAPGDPAAADIPMMTVAAPAGETFRVQLRQ